MRCEQVQLELEDFLGGELTERRAGEVRAHLAGCADCRAARTRAEAENAAFAAFYERSAIEPAGEMWTSIRDRIRTEPAPVRAAEPTPRGWRQLGDLSLLAVLRQAAFAAVLIALSVLATAYLLTRGGGSRDVAGVAPSPKPAETPAAPTPSPSLAPAPQPRKSIPAPALRRPSDEEMIQQQIARAEREYQGAVRLLERAIARRRDSLDPAVLRQYESSLALIDDSIRQSRQALREQPNDVGAGQFLLAAYARKVELMQDIAMR